MRFGGLCVRMAAFVTHRILVVMLRNMQSLAADVCVVWCSWIMGLCSSSICVLVSALYSASPRLTEQTAFLCVIPPTRWRLRDLGGREVLRAHVSTDFYITVGYGTCSPGALFGRWSILSPLLSGIKCFRSNYDLDGQSQRSSPHCLERSDL
jgi:hypothetical protein